MRGVALGVHDPDVVLPRRDTRIRVSFNIRHLFIYLFLWTYRLTWRIRLEYAVLLVTFFVKLYKEHTRSSSSGSQFSLPAGYLSFEVSLKWGAPKPSEARETNTEGRRED